MTRYRNNLPQLAGELYLTDGGIETTLIFHEGLELPHFAAFHLLKTRAGYPCDYMINRAHPTHFDKVLAEGAPLVERIRGLRANASRMSHAELNESPTLDTGDATELGQQYADLKMRPNQVRGRFLMRFQKSERNSLLKKKYDPANFFRFNQPIQPRGDTL